MATEVASVRRMRAGDPVELAAAFRALGWPGKTVESFNRYVEQDLNGTRTCFVATSRDEVAGYCTLLWESRYSHFLEAGVPEVSDLNVFPSFRNHGIGNALLDAVEAAAAQRCASVGLGVGLYADYGAAQRIYVKRGYVPDGRGLMYNYTPVAPGNTVRNDDDANLMFLLTF